MKHAALAVVVVLALLGLSTTARAALLPHYDLTSLAFQAQNVVRAKRTSDRTMVVVANYKGALAVGESFEVSLDGYSMEAYEDLFNPPSKPPPIAPEMILFLSPKREVLASGLRIFREGKAMRFGQVNNPGGYYPTPQGLDPADLCNDPRAKKDVDLASLEAQIAVALRRSAEVKRVLRSPDSRALARLVGEVIELGDEPSCYDDAVARAILDELVKRRDVPALLDAASRTREDRYWFTSEADAHELALFASAENSGMPLTSRLAALRILRQRGHFLFENTSLDTRFAALVSDADPRIRAAALLVRGSHRSIPAMQTAIRSLWATEKDDRVRVALVRAAWYEKIGADLMTPGATWPVFAISVENGHIEVPWALPDPNASLYFVSAKITMKQSGQSRTASLSNPLQMLYGGGAGLIAAPIDFDPPLAAGTYDAEIAVVLGDQRQMSTKSLKKTVRVAGVQAPSPLAIPPAVTASTFPIDDSSEPPPSTSGAPSASASAPAPAPSPSPSVSVAVPPKRTGCGCEVVSRRVGTLELLASLAALALFVARRSQRSRA